MTTELTQEQAQYLSAGLYRLAAVDGVDDRELAVIKEFLHDMDLDSQAEDLAAMKFEMAMLPWVLDTEFLRQIFLRSCWALVLADGDVSSSEEVLIAEYAEELGMLENLSQIKASAVETSLF